MRNIINISVPEIMKKEIEHEVKIGGYASVSEFFRTIIRERKENVILHEAEESRQEFLLGKSKTLLSLKNLR
jgi:Arc/MetJ-type ribon-helix-helix transcriptional regulator